MTTNTCGDCRRCCKGTLVRATKQDVKRWRQEGRYDIILCLETWMGASAYLIHKKDKDECIFLAAEGCEIYETRPKVCRDFPKSERQAQHFTCHLTPRKHRLRPSA